MAAAASDFSSFLFIQMGGTIDKTYPKTTGGYSFEIEDPALERVLSKIKPSFGPKFHVKSVCKKDSQEITSSDR